MEPLTDQEPEFSPMAALDQVSGFISATFRSVWALELLLLLRQNRGRSLTHQEMVEGLRGSDLVVTRGLESLAAAGLVLVETDGAARYASVSDDLDGLVGETEAIYGTSPDAVRRLIVAAANPGLRDFADSFRLRGDTK